MLGEYKSLKPIVMLLLFLQQPVPPEIMTSVPAPSLSSIRFHQLSVHNNWPSSLAKAESAKFPLKDLAVSLQLADCHSNFVTVRIIYDCL